MNKLYAIKIFMLIVFTLLTYFTYEGMGNFERQEKKLQYTVLSIKEMILLTGGACSNGPCEPKTATGCGVCAPLLIGICQGVAGNCSHDTQQLKCWCGVNDHIETGGCVYAP